MLEQTTQATEGTPPVREWTKRAADNGIWCTAARRASELWDFIDKRDIEKYVISLIILFMTYRITEWTFAFAEKHMDKSGVELAAVIAAILVPWSGIQGFAIKWLFEARTGNGN